MIEDKIHMYVIDKPSTWEDCLHVVEFSYNNGKQAYLEMSQFEYFYGRKCRTLVTWDNLVNKIFLGPEMLKEMEQEVARIRKNLKTSQDR